MRVFCFLTFLATFASGSFHPRDQKIANQESELYVDDSMAIAGGKLLVEAHGNYEKYYPVTAMEHGTISKMTRGTSEKWTLQGVWIRHNPEIRYLLVLNPKSESAEGSQRWIISSPPNTIWRDTRGEELDCDPFPPLSRFPKIFRHFSQSPEMRLSHASNSENAEESVQTGQDPRDEVVVKAKTEILRLEGVLKVRSNELQQYQDWCAKIASEIKRLKHQIATQQESQSVIETENEQLRESMRHHVAKITERQSEVDVLRITLRQLTKENADYQQSQAAVEREIQNLKEEVIEQQMRQSDELSDQENSNLKEKNDQLISELAKVREQMSQLTEDSNNEKHNTVILLCSGGTVLVVVLILCAAFHYRTRSVASRKMEIALRNQGARMLKANEPLPEIPSVHANRLGVNEHPAVRDRFGMEEVFDVTAGEGQDLVRIARPLETAGAERKLSEELMDIQPIIAGREGAQSITAETVTGGYSEKETNDGNNDDLQTAEKCEGHKAAAV